MAVVINGNGAVTGLTALPDSAMASGSVIQVVETKITAKSSVNMTTTYTDVAGFSVTITPSSASNKIKLTAMINQSSIENHGGGRFVRSVGGTDTIPTGWIGDASGNRTQSTTGNLFAIVFQDHNGSDVNFAIPVTLIDDSHSTTSAITYKFQVSCISGTFPIRFNTADDDDIAATHVAVSSLIAEEIVA
tara:strand:- start:265 stop:834 length:570 start_codon:yes stop_codon:yes gene_type:complete